VSVETICMAMVVRSRSDLSSENLSLTQPMMSDDGPTSFEEIPIMFDRLFDIKMHCLFSNIHARSLAIWNLSPIRLVELLLHTKLEMRAYE
jgi:hypothetical protein